MASGRTLTVYLAADTDKFRREMRQAQDGVGKFNGAIGGMAGNLKYVLGGALIGAGIALGNFAKDFAVDGIKAAAANEAAMAKLTKQLELLGLAADAGRVAGFIDQLSRASGVSDTELFPAFTNLVRVTGDVDEAMKLLGVGLDVAAGTGKPLETVMNAITKAAGGSAGALDRLIPGLRDTGTEGATTDGKLRALADKFEGQYKTAAETYEGKILRVKTAFGELQEAFGTGFLQALNDANTAQADYADTVASFDPIAEKFGGRLGEIVTAFATVIEFVNGAKDAVNEWLGSLEGVQKFVFDTGLKFLYALVNPIDTFLTSVRNAIAALRELHALMGGALGGSTPVITNGQGTPGRPLPATRSASRVTESAVGDAIYRVLANTDARNGYVAGAVLR